MLSPFLLLDHVCNLFSHSGNASASCASNYKCRRSDIDQSNLWHLKVSRTAGMCQTMKNKQVQKPRFYANKSKIQVSEGLQPYTNPKFSQGIRCKIQEIMSNLGKLFANKQKSDSQTLFYSNVSCVSISLRNSFFFKWFIEGCPRITVSNCLNFLNKKQTNPQTLGWVTQPTTMLLQ